MQKTVRKDSTRMNRRLWLAGREGDVPTAARRLPGRRIQWTAYNRVQPGIAKEPKDSSTEIDIPSWLWVRFCHAIVPGITRTRVACRQRLVVLLYLLQARWNRQEIPSSQSASRTQLVDDRACDKQIVEHRTMRQYQNTLSPFGAPSDGKK
jgi:hypothetical protein